LQSICRSDRQGARGAALILLLLALVSLGLAGAGVVLPGLFTAWHRRADTVSVKGLLAAKRALLEYVVARPQDPTQPLVGPGRLPCPDLTGDGVAALTCHAPCPDLTGDGAPDPPCEVLVKTAILGRLPWRTLGFAEHYDGTGQGFWYAVTADFVDTPPTTALSAHTAGAITADGEGDLVAVILAPQAPFTDLQSARQIAPQIPAQFLEGSNAVAGTREFVSAARDPWVNDHLVGLRRAELVTAVGRRVLAEVATALKRYAEHPDNLNTAYPWPSPFADPSTVATPLAYPYQGQAGLAEGLLGVHLPHTVFLSPAATVSWAIQGGDATATTGSTPPVEACLRSGACNDPGSPFNGLTDPLPLPLACTWSTSTALFCTHTISSGGFNRTYAFWFTGAQTTVIHWPTPTMRSRSRAVGLFGMAPPVAAQTLKITITEHSPVWDGSRTIAVNTDSENTGDRFAMAGLDHQIDPDAGEIPLWITANHWYQQVYLAYPRAETVGDPPDPGLPGSSAACTPGTDCLTVDGAGDQSTKVRALLIFTGMDMPGPTPLRLMDPNDRAAYLEGENASDGDDHFTRTFPLNQGNDQLWGVRTAP
jgi:hypothetical protein